MSNWKEKHLGDVLQFQRGFDLLAKDRTEGLIPVVSSSGITGYHNTAKAKKPGVIIGRKGTLGTVHYINTDYWPHDTTLWIKDFKENLPRFVYYFLKLMHLEKFDVGASNPTLNRNHIHKIKLVFPPIETQRKIAGILSAYDDLIENNKRRIALLEKMAEEIYREWFVRMRFPGHESTKFEKGLPTGWEVKELSSISKEIRSGIKKNNLKDNDLYVGLEHISRKSISLKENTTANTINSDKLVFKERDILFGKIRPYLHKVVLSHVSGACSSDTIVIRPKDRIYEAFILFTVFSETFIELATISSKGTKMPRADWDFLKKLELKIPSRELAQQFQNQFDSIFQQIILLLRSNENLQNTRDRLLPRLISGKLSVDNLDIQNPPSMQ